MLAVIEREIIPTKAEFRLSAQDDLRGRQTVWMMDCVDGGRVVVDGFLDEAGKGCALDLEIPGGFLADVVDYCVVVGTENAVVPVADWRGMLWEGTPYD